MIHGTDYAVLELIPPKKPATGANLFFLPGCAVENKSQLQPEDFQEAAAEQQGRY